MIDNDEFAISESNFIDFVEAIGHASVKEQKASGHLGLRGEPLVCRSFEHRTHSDGVATRNVVGLSAEFHTPSEFTGGRIKPPVLKPREIGCAEHPTDDQSLLRVDSCRP